MDESLLETLPLAHRLALSYAPARARVRTGALLALNQRLAGIVRQAGEPVIAQMKLAWWRDRFAQAPVDWPVGEPLLAALAESGGDTARLGALVDGWEALLAERLGETEIAAFADGHAAGWHWVAGGSDAPAIDRAARQWALADLARNLGDAEERARAAGALRSVETPGRLPRGCRTLAVLRALALRALDRGEADLLAGPGAALLAMRVGISGR